MIVIRTAGNGDHRELRWPGPASSWRVALAGAALSLSGTAAQAYLITGTYQNYGTWNDSLYIDSTGKFINLSGALLDSSQVTNGGTLDNRAGGLIRNRTKLMNSVSWVGVQLLYNSGQIDTFSGALLENYAYLYNYAGATMSSLAGATTRNFGDWSNAGSFTNAGLFEQSWINVTGGTRYRQLSNTGTLVNTGAMNIAAKTALANSGLFSNSGTVSGSTTGLNSSGTWNNTGTLNVNGTPSSDMSGQSIFTNTGSLNNSGTVASANGTIRNRGSVVNDGTITNTSSNYIGEWGRFTNYAGASLVNRGSFSTNHVLDNAGSINNTGTLTASYQLNNLAGATLSNAAGAALKGHLNNSGTVDNQGSVQSVDNAGVFTHAAGATQADGVLINRGKFTNAAGASLSSFYEVSNAARATLLNHGTMNHWYSDWWPSGTSNAGTIINDGSIVNHYGRSFSNAGTLDNQGSLSGSGEFVQTAGSTVNTGSWAQASMDIRGGTFVQRAGSLATASLKNAGVFFASGSLQVDSFANAGQLLLGESLSNALTIAGSFAQTGGGVLASFLSGLHAGTEYGTLSVTGSATVAGTLSTGLWFSPVAGDRFNVLHADGGITGRFDTVSLGPLGDGLAWQVDYTGTDLWLTVAAAPPVPEPGTGWLLALGLAGLVGLRRRPAGTSTG
jgi:hypothetical protein